MAPCHCCCRGHITPGPPLSCSHHPRSSQHRCRLTLVTAPVVIVVVVTSPPPYCHCANVIFCPPPTLLLWSHHPRPTAIALTSFTACCPCRRGHITPNSPSLRSRWLVCYHHPQLIDVALRLSPALLLSRAHSIATCRHCAHNAMLSLSPAHHCCTDSVQDTTPSW